MLSPVNFSPPKKRGLTTLNSEQPLEVSTAIVEDEHQPQGVTSVSLEERPLGSITEYTTHQQPHQRPEIPVLESVLAVVQGTENSVTISEPSSTLGAPVKVAAISISEHDLLEEPLHSSNVSTHEDAASYQSPPLGITGESYRVADTSPSVVGVGTGEKSSGKGLLKGT